MQVRQAKYNLRRVEPGSVLRETNFVAQMKEKLATIEEIGDEVETFSGLKSIVELDHERVRNLLHDVPLNLHLVRLVCPEDEVLFECLDRIDLAV